MERLTRQTSRPPRRTEIARPGDLAVFVYELGAQRATGVLRIAPPRGAHEQLSVRVGEAVTDDHDALGRQMGARLAWLASLSGATLSFEPGAAPGGERTLSLVTWGRQALERELDLEASQALARELAEHELRLLPGRAPDLVRLDESERRLVAALARPRRFSELASVARIARYRLLTFLHFLRAIGALGVEASDGARPVRRSESPPPAMPPVSPPRLAALDLLGLPLDADTARVKQTFRRLARAFHPDRHPHLGEAHRRALELRLARLTAAYAELVTG